MECADGKVHKIKTNAMCHPMNMDVPYYMANRLGVLKPTTIMKNAATTCTCM